MTNTDTAPTTANPREILAAILNRATDGLTDEQVIRLIKREDALAAATHELLKKLAREEPPPLPAKESPKPQTVHADICIERVIGGRKFRFRGFIRDDDADGYVLGDTMLERVRKSGDTPNEKEDNEYIEKHRAEWVNDTELAPYYVVTNERHPGLSRDVRYFYRGIRGRLWYNLDFGFLRSDLVACRAA